MGQPIMSVQVKAISDINVTSSTFQMFPHTSSSPFPSSYLFHTISSLIFSSPTSIHLLDFNLYLLSSKKPSSSSSAFFELQSMASEAQVSELSALFERMIRNRDLPLFLPFIFGFTNFSSFGRDSPDPDQQENSDMNETPGTEAAARTTTTTAPRDRLILINPITQSMFVMDGASNWETMLGEMGRKVGQPPASKESIESMPCVEIGEGEEGECVICLEEWETGGVVKEMPCKHRFHGNCIESWLKIHGTCPFCRYKMPVDDRDMGKKTDDEIGGERREIWLHFSFDDIAGRRSGDSAQPPSHAQEQDQAASVNSNDSSSTRRADDEIDG